MDKDSPEVPAYVERLSGSDNINDIPREMAMDAFLDTLETIEQINPADAVGWLQTLGVKPNRAAAIVKLARQRDSFQSPWLTADELENCSNKPLKAMTRKELLTVVEDMQSARQQLKQARYQAIVDSLEYDELLNIEHWIDENLRGSMRVERVDARGFIEANNISNEEIIERFCMGRQRGDRKPTQGRVTGENGEEMIWTVKNGRNVSDQ